MDKPIPAEPMSLLGRDQRIKVANELEKAWLNEIAGLTYEVLSDHLEDALLEAGVDYNDAKAQYLLELFQRHFRHPVVDQQIEEFGFCDDSIVTGVCKLCGKLTEGLEDFSYASLTIKEYVKLMQCATSGDWCCSGCQEKLCEECGEALSEHFSPVGFLCDDCWKEYQQEEETDGQDDGQEDSDG